MRDLCKRVQSFDRKLILFVIWLLRQFVTRIKEVCGSNNTVTLQRGLTRCPFIDVPLRVVIDQDLQWLIMRTQSQPGIHNEVFHLCACGRRGNQSPIDSSVPHG